MVYRSEAHTMLMASVARVRVTRYLRAIGYRVVDMPDAIVATRHRSLEWLPGSPPRWWPARVSVEFSEEGLECHARLRWDVATRGKVFSIWDASYFRREIQGALNAMEGDETRVVDLDAAHRALSRKTLALHLAVLAALVLTGTLVATGDLPPSVWAVSLFIVLALLSAVRASSAEVKA